MPAVLIHGVPERAPIWDRVRSHLARADVVALELPGFGRDRPEAFGAGKDDYVAWLARELEPLVSEDGPVDLVGHDWGGGFVVRLVSTRPELFRSWVSDAPSLGHPDMRWHAIAEIWQTPGAGEEFFEQQLALTDEQRAATYEAFGVPPDAARQMAGWIDRGMADSILTLYRSAVDIGRDWSPEFHDIPVPGRVIVPMEDPFLADDLARDAAARAGAEVVELEGLGHWWLLQDPERGAAVLEEFWSVVGRPA